MLKSKHSFCCVETAWSYSKSFCKMLPASFAGWAGFIIMSGAFVEIVTGCKIIISTYLGTLNPNEVMTFTRSEMCHCATQCLAVGSGVT